MIEPRATIEGRKFFTTNVNFYVSNHRYRLTLRLCDLFFHRQQAVSNIQLNIKGENLEEENFSRKSCVCVA